jgi:RHS repeat-associated protein
MQAVCSYDEWTRLCYKFTGKERDSESGLDMFGARYYTNAIGRFITPDWSESPEPVHYANFENAQNLFHTTKSGEYPTVSLALDRHRGSAIAFFTVLPMSAKGCSSQLVIKLTVDVHFNSHISYPLSGLSLSGEVLKLAQHLDQICMGRVPPENRVGRPAHAYPSSQRFAPCDALVTGRGRNE